MATLNVNPDRDNHVRNDAPTSSYGTMGNFGVGNNNGYMWRYFAHFDFSGLPAGAIISAAVLYLTTYSYYSAANLSATHWFQRLTSSFEEGVNTYWNQVPTVDATQHASRSVSININNLPATESFDLTALVTSWVNGTYTNHGFMLRTDELSADTNAWYSREGTTPPYITITYTVPPGAPGAFTNPVLNQSVKKGTTLAVAFGAATDSDTATGSLVYEVSHWNGSAWSVLGNTAAGSTTYNWSVSQAAGSGQKLRARAYDGTNYGPYTESALFNIVAGGARTIVGA